MQYFRPGSQLRQLITMLSIVGEYPIRSLYLLGNERAYKALVHKLTTPETFRIPQTETELTGRIECTINTENFNLFTAQE